MIPHNDLTLLCLRCRSRLTVAGQRFSPAGQVGSSRSVGERWVACEKKVGNRGAESLDWGMDRG
jgi:hypothetical protein